jgi:hypothetical protein
MSSAPSATESTAARREGDFRLLMPGPGPRRFEGRTRRFPAGCIAVHGPAANVARRMWSLRGRRPRGRRRNSGRVATSSRQKRPSSTSRNSTSHKCTQSTGCVLYTHINHVCIIGIQHAVHDCATQQPCGKVTGHRKYAGVNPYHAFIHPPDICTAPVPVDYSQRLHSECCIRDWPPRPVQRRAGPTSCRSTR